MPDTDPAAPSGTALYDTCVCGHVRGGHGRPGGAAVEGRTGTLCHVCSCPRFRGATGWRRGLQRLRDAFRRDGRG
ncbi:hypothetical protein [Vallicoccus soli]|uniref:Uncharacterized protein n=1 Tax=Vallicoccus soli TaxID=2339232 RepID=A0A3A3ZCT4_9ACTN|nr:hypothetical protein [Vallicoccus soli]RJK92784.1 hypothetical protein D5H78_18185 [Vallicoccus soli]